MDAEIVDGLNDLLSIEYTSFVQLMQHSYCLQGVEREAFLDLLRDHAKETVAHAAEIGDKIVALGGVPTIQLGTVRQSTDWKEMLQQDLEQHRDAVAKIDALVGKCEERHYVAVRVLLENGSYEETRFIEDLERALSQKRISFQQQSGKVSQVRVRSKAG